jgi:very-short-patch-repair endonuclease
MRRLHDLPAYRTVRRRLRTHGTPAEAALWRLLHRGQLYGRRFRRQHGVGPYVLDFYCPAERLAVELDGAVHNAPERQAYDTERERHLAAVSIRVVRFENRAVFEAPEAVLAGIAAAFRTP